MRKRRGRWTWERCGHTWGMVTLVAIAGFLLAVFYPLGLLMFLLGAVIACIVFCVLYD